MVTVPVIHAMLDNPTICVQIATLWLFGNCGLLATVIQEQQSMQLWLMGNCVCLVTVI